MGIRLEFSPHLLPLMSAEDQAKFGPGIHPQDPKEEHKPPVRTNTGEKVEQRHFANYCLLHDYPFTWHATHKPSTATPGTPDFMVGVNYCTLWIEFKLWGQTLSKPQEEFKERLARQGIQLYVVYTCNEAIALVKDFDRVTL